MAQVFNADGTRRGGTRVVAYTTDLEYEPSVGIDAAGDFVVAYTDRSGSTSHVFAALSATTAPGRRSPSTARPSRVRPRPVPAIRRGVGNSPIILTNYLNHQPTVSMNDSGQFVVAYTQDVSTGGQQNVVARRYDATAAPQGYLFTVANTSGHDLQPSVALNDSGKFVIAYTEDNNPQRNRRRNSSRWAR